MESLRWVLLDYGKFFEITLWRHQKIDFSKIFIFFENIFFKMYLLFRFSTDFAHLWLKRTVRWVGSNCRKRFFRFLKFLPIFFKKTSKKAFLALFLKKMGKNFKNRKKCFLQFEPTHLTVLLSHRWAKSVERRKSLRDLKKKFSKKMEIFENSLFWWRHNAISKIFY